MCVCVFVCVCVCVVVVVVVVVVVGVVAVAAVVVVVVFGGYRLKICLRLVSNDGFQTIADNYWWRGLKVLPKSNDL